MENAVSCFDPTNGAPTGDEGARERRVEEINQNSIVTHTAHAGGCESPAIGSAVLIKPCGHFRMPPPKAVGGNGDPDANGEPPLSEGNRFVRITGDVVSSFFVRKAQRDYRETVQLQFDFMPDGESRA
jgi:hypothetical protein